MKVGLSAGYSGATMLLLAGLFAAPAFAQAPMRDLPAATGEASMPAPAAESTETPAAPEAPATEASVSRSCFSGALKASPREVEAFIAEPAALVADPAITGPTLTRRVRVLAGSDSRTIDPLLALTAGGSADQKSAIGAGLGAAAFACAKADPTYAAEIQAKVAGASSAELALAFTTASSDLQVASIAGATGGGGGGGAAAGLAGGGQAGPGSGGATGDNVVATTTETYSLTRAINFTAGNGGSVTRQTITCVSCSTID